MRRVWIIVTVAFGALLAAAIAAWAASHSRQFGTFFGPHQLHFEAGTVSYGFDTFPFGPRNRVAYSFDLDEPRAGLFKPGNGLRMRARDDGLEVDNPNDPEFPIHSFGGFEFGQYELDDGSRSYPFRKVIRGPGRLWYFAAPMWFATLVFAAAFLGSLHLCRRSRTTPGCCPACGYDLRATPGRCPECGEEEIQPEGRA